MDKKDCIIDDFKIIMGCFYKKNDVSQLKEFEYQITHYFRELYSEDININDSKIYLNEELIYEYSNK